MAQSSLTVTPPNPTPPTNFSCTGVSGPNPPNYTKNSYANPFNLSAIANAGGPALVTDQRPQSPYGVNQAPPPFFDDGTALTGTAFAANTSALASGTGATSGGTENTYPGVGGLTPPAPNMGGAVPASASSAAEGAGTEQVVTQTYPATIYNPAGPLVTTSCLGNFTGVASPPNAQHASSLSPSAATTLTSINPTSSLSGASGTYLQTCTGTNFTRQSVIYVNGVAQVTTFVSSTSLTANVTKKTSAGTWPVVVITAGATTTLPQTWTFT